MENYGQGKSTNIEQTVLGAQESGLPKEDLVIQENDREILRGLAARVAEIAASERQAEIADAWRAHNRLNPVRPVFFCDPENGWNEIITDAEMKCSGRLARVFEMRLRKKIFSNDEMRDDTPVDGFFDIPYTVGPDDWGLKIEYHRTQDDGAENWDAPLQDYDHDLPKIELSPLDVDFDTTDLIFSEVEKAIGDLLNVRKQGMFWWSLGVTMPAIHLRGIEKMMFDCYDYPDELKEFLRRISAGHLKRVDELEEKGLLCLNNDSMYVGSGGYGFSDELPESDFAGSVRAKDMWGFTDSQETVSLSPEMYEEFIFPYEKVIMERFGLTCYGCCEPLDTRWHVVKNHPNLRRVSCSPWADYEKMADWLKRDYIFSMKVSPTPVSVSNPDFGQIRQDLRKNISRAKNNVFEVIMKDNHTIGGRPENMVEWCRIVREELGL